MDRMDTRSEAPLKPLGRESYRRNADNDSRNSIDSDLLDSDMDDDSSTSQEQPGRMNDMDAIDESEIITVYNGEDHLVRNKERLQNLTVCANNDKFNQEKSIGDNKTRLQKKNKMNRAFINEYEIENDITSLNEGIKRRMPFNEHEKPVENYTTSTQNKGDQSVDNNSQCHFCTTKLVPLFLTLLIIIVCAYFYLSPDRIGACANCDSQLDSSPNQHIWLYLNVGISEVKQFNKPSVFLYLYNKLPEQYVDEFIHNVSLFASCKLNDHHEEPIELTNKELDSSKAHSDYGYIIHKYKSELEARKVMIVKHLERVPGIVAQAFHTFCDEYTPLVSKSLFVFTMEVDSLVEVTRHDSGLVENTLRSKWSELDEDIFAPLFTRISHSILRIK